MSSTSTTGITYSPTALMRVKASSTNQTMTIAQAMSTIDS